MKIKEMSVFITGANRGIGLALAEQAAKAKMRIHLLGREDNAEVREQLKAKGALDVSFWPLDLADRSSIESCLEQLRAHGECPDLLINNAGQLTGGLLEEQDLNDIYQMIQVNVTGLIHLTRGLLPQMLKLPEAKIVNNASVSGLMHLPCASTYSASKAAVVGFTESLRNELKGTSVSTMVMITPGVKTRMYDKIFDLYGGHMDLSFLSAISAEDWAERVFDHIKKDNPICWPQGSNYWGVQISRYTPSLFGKLIQSYFKRNQ